MTADVTDHEGTTVGDQIAFSHVSNGTYEGILPASSVTTAGSYLTIKIVASASGTKRTWRDTFQVIDSKFDN